MHKWVNPEQGRCNEHGSGDDLHEDRRRAQDFHGVKPEDDRETGSGARDGLEGDPGEFLVGQIADGAEREALGDRVTSDEQRIGGTREDDDEREHEADDGANEAGADGQLATLEAAPRERERDTGREEERADGAAGEMGGGHRLVLGRSAGRVSGCR